MASLAAKTMIYRGLGSGIIRVMKEGVRVDFVNEESANQFRTIVWRTIQKNDSTIQKEDESTTQKSDVTTQKNESTTQKSNVTTQKELTTTQKAVLDYFKNHPKGNRVDAALAIGGITEDGVKFIIGRLQQLGLLKREGGRKNGTWVVMDE
jgi:predicted HTH transcriptional regulator